MNNINIPVSARIFILLIFSKLLIALEYISLKYCGLVNDTLINKLSFGDSHWYLSIAKDGYLVADVNYILHNATNLPFFPMLPIVIKFFSIFFSSNIAIIIFNQVLSWISVFMMYKYVNKTYSNKIALYAITLFIFSTEQIYFLSVYTESIFIFLLLLFLILIQNNRYFLSSIVVCMLSATKFVGFLLVLIIAYQYLTNCLNNKNMNQLKISQILTLLIYMLVGVSGLLMFMGFLYYKCNDYLAFYHAQAIWGRKTVVDVITSLPQHPIKTFADMIHGSMLDGLSGVLIWFLFVGLYMVKDRINLLVLLLLIGPALATFNTISLTRFIFAIPATYIYFANFMAKNSIIYSIIISITLILSFYVWFLVFVYGGMI